MNTPRHALGAPFSLRPRRFIARAVWGAARMGLRAVALVWIMRAPPRRESHRPKIARAAMRHHSCTCSRSRASHHLVTTRTLKPAPRRPAPPRPPPPPPALFRHAPPAAGARQPAVPPVPPAVGRRGRLPGLRGARRRRHDLRLPHPHLRPPLLRPMQRRLRPGHPGPPQRAGLRAGSVGEADAREMRDRVEGQAPGGGGWGMEATRIRWAPGVDRTGRAFPSRLCRDGQQ